MTKQLVSRVAVATGIACFLGLGAHVARATPIHIVEGGLIDLKEKDPVDVMFYHPPETFTLGTGVNTFSDSVSHDIVELVGFDTDQTFINYGSDLFNVTVPAGMQITQVEVNVSNYQTDEGVPDSLTASVGGFNLVKVPLGLVSGVQGVVHSGDAFLTGGPDEPGTYAVYAGGLFNVGINTNSADYVMSMTVTPTPVPEPATLSLFALGGLTLLRRRRV
jgi:hypothetical protein